MARCPSWRQPSSFSRAWELLNDVHTLRQSQLHLSFPTSHYMLGGSEEELQQLTERVEKTAAGYCMQISSNKSKILVNSIKPRPFTNISADRSTSSQNLLSSLHWLPIQQRITYELANVVYKSVNVTVPLYLSRLLNQYTYSRQLRLSEQHLLSLPRTHTLLLAPVVSVVVVLVFGWNSFSRQLCVSRYWGRLRQCSFVRH